MWKYYSVRVLGNSSFATITFAIVHMHILNSKENVFETMTAQFDPPCAHFAKSNKLATNVKTTAVHEHLF